MLDSVLQTNGETCTSFYVVRFAQRTKLKQAIADVKEKYGLADGAVEENLAAVALAINTDITPTKTPLKMPSALNRNVNSLNSFRECDGI